MTNNQIQYWRLQEEKRHQKAVERETEKNNRRVSQDKRLQAYLEQKARAQANVITGAYNEKYLTELSKHNRELEQLQYLQHQRELAKLGFNQQQINLGYDQLANARTVASINAGVGYAQVGAQYANLAELQRANLAKEELQLRQQNEAMRHNLSAEELGWANQRVGQQQANANTRRQAFEEQKWSSIGYANEVSKQALTWAQTNQAWANTELSQTQKSLAGVNAVSNLIGSGANVIRAIKGGTNVSKPKPKVQWPDGSYSY